VDRLFHSISLATIGHRLHLLPTVLEKYSNQSIYGILYTIIKTSRVKEWVKNERVRKTAKLSKCYIVIFVCFASTAIHIELATDLFTEAFLNVFKHFISRKGYSIYGIGIMLVVLFREEISRIVLTANMIRYATFPALLIQSQLW